MYFSDLKSWYIMYCLWTSSRILALMTAWRSVSMYSNMRYRSRSFSAFRTFKSLHGEFSILSVSEIHYKTLSITPDYIVMRVEVLQEHDFSERPLQGQYYSGRTNGLTGETACRANRSARNLCICGILESVKDLFEGHHLPCFPVDSLPDDAVSL